jgi:hypothetical protein
VKAGLFMRILRYLTDFPVIGDGVADPLVDLEQQSYNHFWIRKMSTQKLLCRPSSLKIYDFGTTLGDDPTNATSSILLVNCSRLDKIMQAEFLTNPDDSNRQRSCRRIYSLNCKHIVKSML